MSMRRRYRKEEGKNANGQYLDFSPDRTRGLANLAYVATNSAAPSKEIAVRL
jgi:hypothetical protein